MARTYRETDEIERAAKDISDICQTLSTPRAKEAAAAVSMLTTVAGNGTTWLAEKTRIAAHATRILVIEIQEKFFQKQQMLAPQEKGMLVMTLVALRDAQSRMQREHKKVKRHLA